MSEEPKYDVVAVNLTTRKVRVLERNKLLRMAEAIVDVAVRRRSVDIEFFSDTLAGEYVDGDIWKGHHNQLREEGSCG